MQYRPDIDGLRAVAVLPVVFYHAGLAGFSGGFVGVDVFFVISGYLISRIIHDEMLQRRFSILFFYERRARRILPALFVVIAANFLAGWILLSPGDYDAMAWSAASVLVFLSNVWFWQNSGGYFDGATDYLPLLHTWSLAVEEQFYILFPLMLLVLVRWGRSTTLVVTVTMVAASLALAGWATPRMPSASFYLLPTRLWEMGAGSVLALGLAPQSAPRWLREAAGLLGLGAILYAVTIYNSATVFPGFSALLPVLGATLLIWVGLAGGSLAGQLLSWRPLVFVGLLSYSMYLWHWPIMSFARNRLLTIELPPVWQLSTILLSLVMAWASWRFVERPFRSKRGGGIGKSAIFAASGAGTVALGAAAAIVAVTGGAQGRFDESELQTLAGPERDPVAQSCGGARPIDQLCAFNKTASSATGSWLFWGDSHAEAMLPAVMAIAAERGQRLEYANQSACAPLPGLNRLDQPLSHRDKCLGFKSRIEQHILGSGTYSTVLLHARWPLYVEGTHRQHGAKTSVSFSKTGDKSLADTTTAGENLVLVEAALLGLVTRLKDAGANVVLIGPVPEIPWNVADRMKALALYGETLPPPPDRGPIMARQGRSETMLRRIARRTGALYVPVSSELCKNTCPTHKGPEIFYRDDHHLSPEGALHLVLPVLQNALSILPVATHPTHKP